MKFRLFKNKYWLLGTFLVFMFMLVVVNFSFADSLGNRLPTYIKLNTLDIDGNVDYKGYALLNVSRIKGNGGPVLFGNQDTSHAVTGSGSIVVDMFEANGVMYGDAGINLSGDCIIADNNGFAYGDSSDSIFKYSTVQTADTLLLALQNSQGNSLLITTRSNNAFNHGHSAQTNPSIIGHSVNQTTDEWWKITHNQTDMLITAGKGDVKIGTHTHVTGDLEVDGEIIGGAKTYAEMYREAYGVATTIDTADVWHMVSTTTVGLLSHWTHDVGDTAAITAYADASGGLVYVTSAGHGMSAGNMISISGSTNYNALEEVVAVWTDSFTVTATWAGDDGAGTWIKGASLTAGASAAGTYKLTWGMTLTPQTNNHIFTAACSLNAVYCPKCRARAKTGTAGDYKEATGSALLTIVEGDIINLIIKNVGANGNVTIRHGNVNLHRI